MKTMPLRKKKYTHGNKHALCFAVKHKYRAYPVQMVHTVPSGDVVNVTVDLGFTLFKYERVGLSGIEAPSTRTKGVEEKQLGDTARVELERLLRTASDLECVVDGSDKYGRTVAVFFSGDSPVSINEQLLNGGFVWSATDSNKDIEMLQLLQGSEF